MNKADRWIASVALIFSGVFYGLTLSFPSRPAIFPRVLLIAMAAMGVLLMVKSFRSKQTTAAPKDVINKEVVITTALILMYALTIPVLGYFVTTPLFLFTLMTVFNPEKKALYAGIAAGTTGFMYMVFLLFLKIWLPKGLLF